MFPIDGQLLPLQPLHLEPRKFRVAWGRDFSPNFPLRLMYKDIRLMLEAGQESGVPLPGLETVREIYEESRAAGQADLDYAATLTVLEKKAGL